MDHILNFRKFRLAAVQLLALMAFILAILLLFATSAAAQTVSQTAAYEEAIGRIWFEGRYGNTPGLAFGATGERDWQKEFSARTTGKQVRDRAALIVANPPAPDACIFRIFGAENYLAEQLRIWRECASAPANTSAPNPIRSVTVQFGSGRTQVVE